MTRRDQLSLKRPPQGARGKGRGKGRGRGKGVKNGSKPKNPKSKVTKSKTVKRKHDVEDVEVSDMDLEENYDDGEDEKCSEMDEPAPPPSRRGRKAKGKSETVSKKGQKKATPKAKVDKVAKPRKGSSKPKTKKTRSPQKQPAVPKTPKASKACGCYVVKDDVPIPEQMIQFTQMIDTSLDLDSFKEAVRTTSGSLGRGSLNAYWSKNTCGLRWQNGRDYQDITTFAFHRGCPGEPRVKMLIAVAAAIHLVA